MSKIPYYQHTFLNEMRQMADPLADAAVQAVYASEDPEKIRILLRNLEQNNEDLPDGLPEEVTTFFKVSGQLPSWANEKKMRQGAAFFSTYGGDLMMMLGLLSLPYDYAAAHGAQVLYLSKRLLHNPAKRLLETGQFILDVTARGAFSSKGKAICSIQKVRLIHATIRYHILQNNQWPEQEWGQPINQEDMAATNLSISLIPLRGLRKLGFQMEHEDMLAYRHLWNVASFIMGVNERLLPDTAKEAYVLEKMIRSRQQAPSEAGQSLTKSLLNYIQQQSDSTFGFLAPLYMRYLLGDQIADWLHIVPHPIPAEVVIGPVKSLNRFKSLISLKKLSFSDQWLPFKNMANKYVMPHSLTS